MPAAGGGNELIFIAAGMTDSRFGRRLKPSSDIGAVRASLR